MNALSALAVLAAAIAQGPIITSPVGDGRGGYAGDGGPASKARLNMPFDVAYDAGGNLFLSDTFNHAIRRVDAKTGVITTVAGSGQKGFSGDGGPATNAKLDEPYGVVLDSKGNLFTADRLNARIRRIDGKTGVITTVAGDGSRKYSGDGGPADRAGLVEPNGVALDPEGKRLFIADVADHRIRVVDLKSGLIDTFAGNGRGKHGGDGGPAKSAAIHGARAVEVGPDGTVWILERQGNTLRSVDPTTGTITTRAGSGAKGYTGDGGSALSATFNGPKEFAIDAKGRLILIVDTENHAIRSFDVDRGTVSTLAGHGKSGGGGDGGLATEAELDRPHGVAFAPDGSIDVGDTHNHRIRRVLATRPK